MLWPFAYDEIAAVDSYEQVEPALGRVHLGDVDVEVAGRISLEPRPLRLVPVHLGQSADPVALQAPMQA